MHLFGSLALKVCMGLARKLDNLNGPGWAQRPAGWAESEIISELCI